MTASLPILLAKAIRVHQWPKNLLVFLPALASQKFGDTQLFVASLEGFLAFCLTASAIYLINDLLDVGHDRQHAAKRFRPFAAAALSPVWGYALAPVLLGAAASIGWHLPTSFLVTLACYVVLALAYSAWLKRILMLDVIVIAIFFGLRVIAGYEATGLDYSVWLLSFTQFLFISFAFLKRDIELASLKFKRDDAPGRGYLAQDRVVIAGFGVASGLISILVLNLYIDSDIVVTLYRAPWVLWLACPIIGYGLGRLWILANRGLIDDDPLTFVLRDPVSYILGLCLALVGLAARFGFPFAG
jgi:4-hydroxybenzoate polyprenyltransferase